MIEPEYEPRLFDGGGDLSKRWYIDYRIWDADKGAFVRKQYSGMNKYRTLAERRRESKKALAEIKELIAAGFTAGTGPVALAGLDMRTATVADALVFVRDQKKLRRGLEDYNRLLKRLHEYPAFGNLPLRLVRPVHAAGFIDHLQKSREMGPKTFNNYRDTLSTVFSRLVKLDLLPKNPCLAIERQRVAPSPMHLPYSEAQRQAIRAELIRRGDRQMLLFISFVYYCFIRSGGELRLLRVRDLHKDTVLVPAAHAKNDKAEHVAIPLQLEALIAEHKLRSYPPDYYVFTHAGTPGPQHVGANYFPLRHRRVLRAAGILDEAHTIYGYKHTGAINLYLASCDIELVRRHCRHAHAGITAKYLRALGVLNDGEALAVMPSF